MMDWYSEGVIGAIEQCRQQRALFIVYIKDDTEVSIQTDVAWNSQEVIEVLTSNPHIAIELTKNSTECEQFSQLFPVLLTPCVFCIGLRGEQLEVRSGPLDNNSLTNVLVEAFKKHRRQTGGPQNQPPGGENEEAVDFENEPPGVNEDSGSEQDQQIVPGSDREEVQRYEERKQEIRERKEIEEREKEKGRESTRRKEGQEMGQWKKDKDDLEKQQWLKERRRQKQEEQSARQEVLNKLEQDRRERASLKKQSSQTTKDVPISHSTPPASSTSSNDSTRIQVRLPFNKSTVLLLSSSDTVETLREQIAEFMEVDSDTISLSCTYPRKELTPELDSTPVSDHGLVPSGVVIVRFIHSMQTTSNSSNDGSILSIVRGAIASFVQFLIMIFVYLKDGITSLFSGSAGSNNSSSASQTQRSSGRIRRFNQEDFKEKDDEKRKNTYNGNSTQQL